MSLHATATRSAPSAHPAPLSRAEPPAADVATLFERLKLLLPEIAAGAAQRERDRELPFALVRRIAEAGLLTVRIPKAYGGPGGSVRDAIRVIVEIASVDSNIAQALRPNYGFIDSLLFNTNEHERDRWFPRLLAGQIMGNAGLERGGAHGAVTSRLERDGDHFTANGSKYYSTGALFADWVTSIALNEDGKETSFVVPRGREGLTLVDDFDTMGQRLTASGSTHYANVRVSADEVGARQIPRDKRNPVIPLFQLYLAAVEAGIARNVLTDAIAFTRRHARPIRHSSAAQSVDDPYVQHSVGEIASQAYAAEAAVLRAAETIDAAWAAGLTQDALTQASIEVAQAHYFAVQAALKAAERLFDVGGASAADRAHNLDRHWRNARTVANHNPRDWKAGVLGAWYLKDEAPPTSGSF
jgi:alkylation response protein AidB-like acyl-CoA dehydrogenase